MGLTADEVKAKFDQAALAIQKYLNEILVPAVNETQGGVKTVNGLGPDGNGNVDIEGASQSYVDAAVQEARAASLPRSGGQVTGDLGVSGSFSLGGCTLQGGENQLTLGAGQAVRLQNVASPTTGSDAANRDYVDRGWYLPAWWDSDLEAAVVKVQALQDAAGADGAGFLFFTDLHWGATPAARAFGRRLYGPAGYFLGSVRRRLGSLRSGRRKRGDGSGLCSGAGGPAAPARPIAHGPGEP